MQPQWPERGPRWGLRSLAIALALLPALGGCVAMEDEGPAIGRSQHESKVSDHYTTGCSTSAVLGLSRQIADEMMCIFPGSFERFEEGDGIAFTGSAVLPYLAPRAIDDLNDAVGAGSGSLYVNSGFRTVAQQLVIYNWYLRGRCNISAAARPGNSNHESGRSLDVSNYSSWKTTLTNHGWKATVPGDPVHFDHLGSADIRGSDVLAFQRLWNRNHPEDVIAEDALYGPDTEGRLAQSPAEGFPMGACAEPEPFDAQKISVTVPPYLPPGESGEVVVTMRNTGGQTWNPGSTYLGTSQPINRASNLYDAATWPSDARAATVENVTMPGEDGVFRFIARAPSDVSDTYLFEDFRLVDDDTMWFGPIVIPVDIYVSSAPPSEPPPPDRDEPVPGDPEDPDDPDDPPPSPVHDEQDIPRVYDIEGGCSAGGGHTAPLGGCLLILGLAAATAQRRRRRL